MKYKINSLSEYFYPNTAILIFFIKFINQFLQVQGNKYLYTMSLYESIKLEKTSYAYKMFHYI